MKERVSKPMSKEQERRIAEGRVSARRVDRFQRRKRIFVTHYMPTIGGLPVKTKSGLFFAKREHAIAAGRRAQKAFRDKAS